jgi:hypothetical protein
MANILYPPPRPQSVGEILDTAFRIFGATLLKCLPYATLAVIIRQLPNIYTVARHRPLTITAWTDPLWWLLDLVAMLIGMVLLAALLLRQYAVATGHPPAMGPELGTGLRRLPGMVLYLILFILGLGVSLMPLALAAMFSGWLRLVVGVLLLLPACCFLLAVSCAWPLMLLTGQGALASMKQSARLTRGSWGRLTLIYTVGLVLLLVLYALAGAIAAVVAGLFVGADVVMMSTVGVVVMVILGAVGTPFYGGLLLAVLGDLSVRKEGADLEHRIAAPASP